MSDEQPLIGHLVDGRYKLLRVLGKGGMGVVYEAEHVELNRRCAVKIIAPSVAKSSAMAKRFKREARLMASISDPHIVHVHDAGVSDEGIYFIAMELLVGESLHEVLRRDLLLEWPRARQITLQVCDALESAHKLGVVHRDMKPANCFLVRKNSGDFVKVLDFGIAKRFDNDATELTATNSLIGTLAYMAPEQYRGDECDHRVDLWATAVMLYRMLAGQLPFRGGSAALSYAIVHNRHPSLHQITPGVEAPPGIDEFFNCALAKRPSERFQSASEFATALRELESTRSTSITKPKQRLPTTDRFLRRAPESPPIGQTRERDRLPSPMSSGPVFAADRNETTADSENIAATPLSPEQTNVTHGAGTNPLVTNEVLTVSASRRHAPPRRGVLTGTVVALVLAGGVGLWSQWRVEATTDQLDEPTSVPLASAPVAENDHDSREDEAIVGARGSASKTLLAMETPRPSEAALDESPGHDSLEDSPGAALEEQPELVVEEPEPHELSDATIEHAEAEPQAADEKPTLQKLTCADLRSDAAVMKCVRGCAKCRGKSIKVELSRSGKLSVQGFYASAPSVQGKSLSTCLSRVELTTEKRIVSRRCSL